MARKRYFKYRGRRIVRRKPKVTKRPLRTLTIRQSPVPDSIICNLRYVGGSTIQATNSGAAVPITLRANSCYAPNQSGVGHQPMGFDNWMNMYSKGVVLSAKVTATFITQSGTFTGRQALVGINKSRLALMSANDDHLEAGNVSYKFISDKKDAVRVTMSYNTKRWFGIKDVSDEDDLKFTNGVNPGKVCYFHVFAQAPVKDIAPFTYLSPGLITVQYQVDYKVKFTTRVDIVGS